MQNQIGKFRTKKASFTTTSNHVLLNPQLDLGAKALHTLINYYVTIPNFTLYKAFIQNETGLGDRAFNRLWRQLKELGYLIMHKLKDEKGIFYYEYELLDIPAESSPSVHDAPLDDAPSGEQPPINKTLKNKTLPNKKTIKKQQQDLPVVAPSEQTLDPELIETYYKAFDQYPTGMVCERLHAYLQRFEHDVVILALEMAGGKHKSVDYAYGILRVWGYEDAYTFDQVVAYEECYR